mmetsp:Transcript_2064/g.7980  ORF Transcript_2064/g.7980 Transcript_2064/m.7980 type:complete len:661 (-) Transcript_2064:1208-3190(-)
MCRGTPGVSVRCFAERIAWFRSASGVRALHTRHVPHGSGSAPDTRLPRYPSGPKSPTPNKPGEPELSGEVSSLLALSRAVARFESGAARSGVTTAASRGSASFFSASFAALAISRAFLADSRRLRFLHASTALSRRQVRPHARASTHARVNVALFRFTFCAMRASKTSPRNSKSWKELTGSHMYVRSPKNTTRWCDSGVAFLGCLICSASSGITAASLVRQREMPGHKTDSAPFPKRQGAHTGVPTMNGSSTFPSSSEPDRSSANSSSGVGGSSFSFSFSGSGSGSFPTSEASFGVVVSATECSAGGGFSAPSRASRAVSVFASPPFSISVSTTTSSTFAAATMPGSADAKSARSSSAISSTACGLSPAQCAVSPAEASPYGSRASMTNPGISACAICSCVTYFAAAFSDGGSPCVFRKLPKGTNGSLRGASPHSRNACLPRHVSVFSLPLVTATFHPASAHARPSASSNPPTTSFAKGMPSLCLWNGVPYGSNSRSPIHLACGTAVALAISIMRTISCASCAVMLARSSSLLSSCVSCSFSPATEVNGLSTSELSLPGAPTTKDSFKFASPTRSLRTRSPSAISVGVRIPPSSPLPFFKARGSGASASSFETGCSAAVPSNTGVVSFGGDPRRPPRTSCSWNSSGVCALEALAHGSVHS